MALHSRTFRSEAACYAIRQENVVTASNFMDRNSGVDSKATVIRRRSTVVPAKPLFVFHGCTETTRVSVLFGCARVRNGPWAGPDGLSTA